MLPPDAIQRAAAWARECDVFLSIGTSGLVWPAAQFAYDARSNGATLVEINLEPTPLTPHTELALHGGSGELLPQVMERLALV